MTGRRDVFESHMHTPLCGHARGEPEEYARFASARGLRGVIVTCHNPMPDIESQEVRMRPDEFDTYLRTVARARDAMAGTAEVRLGLECDFIPGYEHVIQAQVRSADFDYVLGAVHPHLPEYRRMHWQGDVEAFQRRYFEHLAESAESGLFDALAHPDMVKIVHPTQWRPERLAESIEGALDRIAATGVAMELNTSGRNKAAGEMFPGIGILEGIRRRDIPIVLGADAHVPERVGDGYIEALETLERLQFKAVCVFEQRKPARISIARARAQLDDATTEPRGRPEARTMGRAR